MIQLIITIFLSIEIDLKKKIFDSFLGASFLAFLISKVHKNLAMPDHIPVGPRISVMSLR